MFDQFDAHMRRYSTRYSTGFAVVGAVLLGIAVATGAWVSAIFAGLTMFFALQITRKPSSPGTHGQEEASE